MPDKENTFVLKADGAMEYLIEAKDAMDMKSWIATIRYCMKTTPTSQMPSHSLDDAAPSNPSLPNTSLISSTGSITETSTSAVCAPSSSTANTSTTGATLNNNNVNSMNNNQLASSSQPEVPPRRPEASSQFHLDEDDLEHESDLTSQMNEYPWYYSKASIHFSMLTSFIFQQVPWNTSQIGCVCNGSPWRSEQSWSVLGSSERNT